MNLLTGLLVLSPVTAVFLGFYALYLILKKKLPLTLNYWSIGLLILFFWSLIVGIVNKSILSSIGSLLILVYFFASQFAQKIISNKDIFHKIINLIVFFTSIASVIGIIEKIVFAFLIGNKEHRIFSLFGNPNMTGCWFVITLFMIAYISIQESEKANIKWYAISATLSVVALLLTGSRGSFAALVGTVILVTILRGFTFDIKTLLIVVGISLITFMLVFAESNIISNFIVAHPFKDSINPRLKIWKDAFLMIKAQPFIGWGLLTTLELGAAILPHYNMPTIHVHNLWLTLLTTMGVVGLSIYLYMKLRLFKDIILLFNNNKDLSLLLISINSIVIIQGFVDVSLYAPQIGIVFSISGAIIAKLASDTRKQIPETLVVRKQYTNQMQDIA